MRRIGGGRACEGLEEEKCERLQKGKGETFEKGEPEGLEEGKREELKEDKNERRPGYLVLMCCSLQSSDDVQRAHELGDEGEDPGVRQRQDH